MSVLPTIVHGCARRRAFRKGVRHVPTLTGGERALARTTSPDGAAALGSDRALYVTNGLGVRRRIEWADIASVGCSGAGTAVVLRLWPTDGHEPDELRVPGDAAFAAFAAERVAATRVLRCRVPILAGSAVVTAVRTPGRNDVIWRVQLGPDCDRDDAAVRLAIQQAISGLRAVAGC